MYSMGKKIISVLLFCVLIFGFFSVGAEVTKASAAKVSASDIQDKLSIVNSSGYYIEGYGDLKPGSTVNKENCWLYVKHLSTFCFGTEVTPPSSKKPNYLTGSTLNSYYRVKPALINCTYAEIVELLKLSEPGDIIGFYSSRASSTNGHIMFIGENTGSKITFYQEYNKTVYKNTAALTEKGLKGVPSFGAYKAGTATFDADDLGVCLFRCKKRDSSGSTSSTPVNDSKKYNSICNIKKDVPKSPSYVSKNDSLSVEVQGRDMKITLTSDSIKNGKIYCSQPVMYDESGEIAAYPSLCYFYISDFLLSDVDFDDKHDLKKLSDNEHVFYFIIHATNEVKEKNYYSLSDLNCMINYYSRGYENTDINNFDNIYWNQSGGIRDGNSGNIWDATANGMKITYGSNSITFSFTFPKIREDYPAEEKVVFNNENIELNPKYLIWNMGMTAETDSDNNSSNEKNLFDIIFEPIISALNTVKSVVAQWIEAIKKSFLGL